MSHTASTFVVASALVLAGCNQTRGPGDSTPVRVVSERHETRLYLPDDCPVVAQPSTRDLTAIGVALAPLLADGALSAVEAFLREREAELTGTHIAQTAGRLYDRKGSLDFGCVVIVRGRFGARHAAIDDDAEQGSLRGRHLTALGLSAFPDFYFEAWATLEQTGEGPSAAVLKVTPQVIQLARTAAKRSDAHAKTVNILFMLSRSALDPGEPPDAEKAFAVLPFQFEALEIGTEISRDVEQRSLLAHQAVTSGIPPSSVDGKRLSTPFNLAAYVEETEQAGPFQRLLLQVFTRKKTALESQLTEIIKDALKTGQGD